MTEHARGRTPQQAAAWAKVEEERRLAGPRGRIGPPPRAISSAGERRWLLRCCLGSERLAGGCPSNRLP